MISAHNCLIFKYHLFVAKQFLESSQIFPSTVQLQTKGGEMVLQIILKGKLFLLKSFLTNLQIWKNNSKLALQY